MLLVADRRSLGTAPTLEELENIADIAQNMTPNVDFPLMEEWRGQAERNAQKVT